MVLFGSAFFVIWFLALAVFNASGRGIHLLLLIPIASYLACAWKENRRRQARQN